MPSTDCSQTRFLKPSSMTLAIITLSLILLDQLSKIWIVAQMQEFQVIPLLPFFNVVLVYNTGAAFSFLAQASGWQNTFFMVLASLASVWIIFLIRSSQSSRERIALSLILAGALGNVLDRVRLGKVVDFLDFHIHSYHWPAFNIADSVISVGAVILLFDILFKQSLKNRKQNDHE